MASEWNQSRIKLRVICVICVVRQKEGRAQGGWYFSMYGNLGMDERHDRGARGREEIKERLGGGYGQGRDRNMYV